MDNTVTVLQRLSDLGIAIAIDDFGTGYSSLAYLKKFPIKQLKIDHSFVRDVSTDTDDAAIVRAVVTMGHGLNLEVVAEGVETAEQLAFLREVGCDAVQGYFFREPALPQDLEFLLSNSR
jgi:EAL domain-containing protein (putative c-di-GMP-specific phosphodiesterase class I)